MEDPKGADGRRPSHWLSLIVVPLFGNWQLATGTCWQEVEVSPQKNPSSNRKRQLARHNDIDHNISYASMASNNEPSVVSKKMQSSRSEQAHWHSFRGEVLQLQHSLVDSLFDGNGPGKNKKRDEINDIRKGSHNTSYCGNQADSATYKINSKQFEASTDENNDRFKENKLPQSQLQLSPLEELDDTAEIIMHDGNNDSSNTTQTHHHHHHYLELTGMEEVDRSICSINNKNNRSSSSHHNNNIPSTNNAIMSHNDASQNTNALSIATQELAEMKLKLAFTEAERDELEFELMQSK